MSARVAVFGTARSGKDHAIVTAMRLLSRRGIRSAHASPVGVLREVLAGEPLAGMDDTRKARAVEEARGLMLRMDTDGVLLADEHYCFPSTYGGRRLGGSYYGEKLPFCLEGGAEGRSYEVVFEDRWMAYYDAAVYMETNPEVVVKRFHESDGGKANWFVTEEDVRLWQLFEIAHIQRLCGARGVPLFYVYGADEEGEVETIISHCLKRPGPDADGNEPGRRAGRRRSW
ncbi:MAG: hypothetical protein IKR86_07440 [Candidatus Methanomethylophilaceae archaeon]|nr:hypothetical protein [Candidatus Methanomethylophilaceae archaeon]